eukprot:s3929_g5.t1
MLQDEFLTPDILESCWRSLSPVQELDLPWDAGIFGQIFSNKPRVVFPALSEPKWNRPVCPEFIPMSSQVDDRPVKKLRPSAEPEHWRQFVSCTDPVSWREDQEAKLDSALKRWYDIILQFPNIHATVKQLYDATSLPEQLRILRDIMAGRAPATLIKRANSMLGYLERLRKAKQPAPGSEELLYAYFCELRDSAVPLSRLRATIEAIRFTEHMFGIEGLSKLLISKRCLGASRLVGDTVHRQADPFTTDQLAKLHETLHDPQCLFWDRLVSGTALVACYTRSRWMDMQHTDSVALDPDETEPVYVELRIKEFKTKRANAWRGGIMSAVGPAIGVVPGNWLVQWWKLRQSLHAPMASGFPLLPAPNSAGEATIRPLSTKEFSSWIRMILGRADLLGPDARLSSHSCKATLLSYLAKYGASIPDREILGGHTSRLKSVITYSRDSVASPLRTLCNMLQMMRDGTFRPDCTRSGYFISMVKQEAITIEDSVEPLVVQCEEPDQTQCQLDTAAGDDHDLCSDTSSDSEEDIATNSHAARMVQAPRAPQGTQLRQHPKSKMLHLLRDEDRNLLMCGRRIADVYKPPTALRWDTPCCGRCWKAANVPLASRVT